MEQLIVKIKRIIKHILVILVLPFYSAKRKEMFEEQKGDNIFSIPIFLICFNRLSYVSQMVSKLEGLGFDNINLIDNCSTYEPLLEYYRNCGHKVFYMKENLGHMVFWKSEVFKEYRQKFYVISDPDLEIGEECPKDFLKVMLEQLEKHFLVRKVGFSLKLDDLPSGDYMEKLLKWEKRFYKKYRAKDNIYYADIDTTFALYLPDSLVSFHDFYDALRTGEPYQVRHLPWYITGQELTAEDRFYLNTKKNGTFDPIEGFARDEDRKSK